MALEAELAKKPGSDMPTEAEAERLVVLMEECGEVIRAASKVLRSGWRFKPYGGEISNGDHLREELDDVLGMIWGMEAYRDIPGVATEARDVWVRKSRWMRHS